MFCPRPGKSTRPTHAPAFAADEPSYSSRTARWAHKIQIGDTSGDKELFLHYDVRPTELYNLTREQLDGMRIRLSAEQWDALDTKWLKMHEQEGASQDKASEARMVAANGQSLPEYQTAKLENIKFVSEDYQWEV